MAGSKTSVYLTDELRERIRGQPRPMAQLLTDALDASDPARPVTRREMRAAIAAGLAPLRADLAAVRAVLDDVRVIVLEQCHNGTASPETDRPAPGA